MKYLLITSILAFLCLGCETDNIPFSAGDSLYFNSFEDGNDSGTFEATYDKDAPAGGGDYSLLINGGCIVPHYEVGIGPFSQEVEVKLSTWGKTMEDRSGSLILYLLNDPSQYLSIEITTPEWQAYEAEGSMVIPAGETATLQFISGGLISVATHYDLVELRVIE